MNQNRWPWILVVLLLAVIAILGWRLRGCEEERTTLVAEKAELEQQLKDIQAPGPRPPDEIPIIIKPPSGGGNSFNIDGGTAQSTFTGNDLSRLAFGEVHTFKGKVQTTGGTLTAVLKRVQGTFGGKTLVISTTGGAKPEFVWTLDGQPMVSKQNTGNQQWNATLCEPLSGGLSVRYVDPQTGQETDGSGSEVQIVVLVPSGS